MLAVFSSPGSLGWYGPISKMRYTKAANGNLHL